MIAIQVDNMIMKYRELFWIILKISTVTFGGGYTIVPILRNEFVIKKRVIEDEEMMNFIALAQSAPGAIAVNTSILIGYRLHGLTGAMTALAASITPPLIIISIITYFYATMLNNPLVIAAFTGIRGSIGSIIFYASINMGRNVLRSNRVFNVLLMVVIFILGTITLIPTIVLILSSGLIGLLYFHSMRHREVLP